MKNTELAPESWQRPWFWHWRLLWSRRCWKRYGDWLLLLIKFWEKLLELEDGSIVPATQSLLRDYDSDSSHLSWTDALRIAIKVLKSEGLAEKTNGGFSKQIVSEILMGFFRIVDKYQMPFMVENIALRCRLQGFSVDDVRYVLSFARRALIWTHLLPYRGFWSRFA